MSTGDAVVVPPGQGEEGSPSDQPKGSFCKCMSLENHPQSRGINFNGIARGAISMSNVYLGNSMILLACKASGGANEAGTVCIDPSNTVYGMKPAALISNIAVAASLFAAFIMPPIGAIVDFTPYRKLWGIIMAVLLALISAIQIVTIDETWLAMAILQAIIFTVYQLELTVIYAYYPEVARDVGEKKMTRFTTTWYCNQFISQASVNLVIIVLSTQLGLGTVKTAWLSQGITAIMAIVFMTLCWRLLPSVPPKHELPKGVPLGVAGFKQNWYMAKNIWKNYKAGLRWFFISTIFAEAAASAVGQTAVIFLSLHLKLTAMQIGIFFEVSLVGVIIGTKFGGVVTRWLNPKTSLIICEIGFGLAVVIGCWTAEYAPVKELTWMWGFSIGIFLGWFYPLEAHFLSFCIPLNVETELAGFFNYCSQIMGWLPPLAFSIVVQNGIELPWALSVVAIHFVPAVIFLLLCDKWEKVVEEGKTVEVDFNFSHMLEEEQHEAAAADENDVETKAADNTEGVKGDEA